MVDWLADAVVVVGGIPWAVIGWIVLVGITMGLIGIYRN